MLSLITNKLRIHLPNRGAFLVASSLLVILEGLTYAFLIWHFILHDALPVSDIGLVIAGGIYSKLALAFIIVNLAGRLLCFKVLGFLYLSIAIFFPLKGFMFMAGRDFTPWGFYALWVVLIIVSFREMIVEVGRDAMNSN